MADKTLTADRIPNAGDDDAAYALLAILERYGDGATVGDVLTLIESCKQAQPVAEVQAAALDGVERLTVCSEGPPENCRQRLRAEGKSYPRSGCEACGWMSPSRKLCDALLVASHPQTQDSHPAQPVEAAPDVPDGYKLVIVPDELPGGEPDWDEVKRQAEVSTGIKVEQHTYSIIIREVRRWLCHKAAQPVREPMSLEQMLACIDAVGTPIPMGLTRDRGPYEITEPSQFLIGLVRAIERHHGIGSKGAESDVSGQGSQS